MRMKFYLETAVILLLGLLSTVPLEVESANILFYQVVGSVSHKISIWPLAKALANRRHNVTFVSHVRILEEVEGLTEINPTMALENSEKGFQSNSFMDRVNSVFIDKVAIQWTESSLTLCEQFLESPEAKPLLSPSANGDVRFDMVIVDPCKNECILGAAHLHGSILVHFVTTGFYPFNIQNTDSPNILPYKAAYALHYPDNTKFIHRVLGVLETSAWLLVKNFYEYPALNKLFKKYYGADVPDVTYLEKQVALTFLNTHSSVDLPTPQMPSVIEVGCLHCMPSKNITDERIRTFLDESSDNGFIFFSFGSFVSDTAMPRDYQLKLLEVFSILKQRVVWKWNDSNLKGNIPPNVMLVKWISQNDVLGHPNIRLFVTHGGKLSTEEAMYHAIPVIVVPMFADQELHGHLATVRGYGKKLNPSQLVVGDNLFQMVSEVLENKSYKENALKWSSILHDQLNDPLEKAVYWTEYVLRHNGASHLQSNVRDFNYFQYYLIDVYAFFLGITIIFFLVIYVMLRMLIKICCNFNRKIKKE